MDQPNVVVISSEAVIPDKYLRKKNLGTILGKFLKQYLIGLI
jgi:hypothetical protein